MKAFSLPRFLLFASGTIALSFLAMPTLAEDAEKVQELQRVIDEQQRQLEEQQNQLDAQKQLLQELETQIKTQAKDKDKKEEAVTGEKPPAKPPSDARSQKRPGLSNADKHDRESPTGSNVTYFDPAATINISGKDTDISLFGHVEFQILHDSDGLDNNRFDTATIPVDGAPSQTKFSVNPSQFAIASATQVAKGQVNTMISMDFNGELDSPDPRLRLAYGEFVDDDGGFAVLGGKAYTTMLDLRAVPETLDFAGPAAMWQTRQELLRYTKSLTKRMITELALETPENVTYINADRRTRWPDFVAAATWLVGSKTVKHFRVSGLLRDLEAESVSTGATDSALGWAVTGSVKLGLSFLGPKDNFKFTLHTGEGYGTQIKGGPAEGVFNNVTSELETIDIVGSYGGLQHFWSDRLRSNFVYGFVNADNPDFVSGDTLDNTQYAAIDLIWTPFKKANFGIEYLWGRRENQDGASGRSNRLLFSSTYNF